MSNVEFGSPSPKVSVETSYRGIGKSQMEYTMLESEDIVKIKTDYTGSLPSDSLSITFESN